MVDVTAYRQTGGSHQLEAELDVLQEPLDL